MAWKSSNDSESGSLKDFRETLKHVLVEITTLEINTIIVDEISTVKFDMEVFIEEIQNPNQIRLLQRASSGQNSEDLKNKLQLKKECYQKLAQKISGIISKIQYEEDAKGNEKIDATGQKKMVAEAELTRYFRKLWDQEQSIINGECTYAQTKVYFDGDVTNKFISDLFPPKEIDPQKSQLIFNLHTRGIENAEKQWSGLIKTCIDLIKDLIPFRAK